MLPAEVRRLSPLLEQVDRWLDDEVFGLLRERQAALCLAEADDGLDTPLAATAPWGYLRLRRANYEDGDLRMWLRRLRDQEWREAFVFFRHEDQAHGPRLAKHFLALAAELSPPRPRARSPRRYRAVAAVAHTELNPPKLLRPSTSWTQTQIPPVRPTLSTFFRKSKTPVRSSPLLE